MAAIGKDGVHKVIGFFCDLCGQECEGDKEELNALGKYWSMRFFALSLLAADLTAYRQMSIVPFA